MDAIVLVGVVVSIMKKKLSAVKFNNISRVYDSGNALKQRIRVNGTYVDFVI